MSSLTDPAKGSLSISGALTVVNSIKTSIATVAGAASYTGAGLNGTVGHTLIKAPRRVVATLAAHTGSYVDASTITYTGLDSAGAALVEVVAIVGTGGGTTITTLNYFTQITKIDIQAQTDTSGAFQFGLSDMLVNARHVRVGTTGDVAVVYQDGSSDTIFGVLAGEGIPGLIREITGSGTTAQNITAYK